MLINNELLKLLYENILFQGASKIVLKSLLKPKNFINVTDGEIIYNIGEETSELFLIVEGEVKIKYSKDRSIENKELFNFFGEVEILTSSKRISSAVANSKCVLYKIGIAELNLLTKSDNTISDNLHKKDLYAISKSPESVAPDLGAMFIEREDNTTEADLEDFSQMKEEDKIETLSDDELDTTVKRLKSRHEPDDMFKKTKSKRDKD